MKAPPQSSLFRFRGQLGGRHREEPVPRSVRPTPQADLDAFLALLLVLLPHIALAPHSPGLDPVLGLSSTPGENAIPPSNVWSRCSRPRVGPEGIDAVRPSDPLGVTQRRGSWPNQLVIASKGARHPGGEKSLWDFPDDCLAHREVNTDQPGNELCSCLKA